MNKVLIITGGIISILALTFVVFDSNEVDESYAPIAQTSFITEETAVVKNKTISYSNTNKRLIQDKKEEEKPVKAKKQEKPEPLRYSVYDTTHQYEITLIDKSQMYLPFETPKADYTVGITGNVNNLSKYAMSIPNHFLKNPANVEIQIRDIKNNTTTRNSASFLYNVKPNSGTKTVIDLDSNDPGNYSESYASNITPPL